jgi:tyrosinase
MGPATSPNEPLFMLHHANVDRAWAKVCEKAMFILVSFNTNVIVQWQGRNATRLADYTGFVDQDKTIAASLTDAMPIMQLGDTQPVVQDYMDIQAGPLCYTYSSM